MKKYHIVCHLTNKGWQIESDYESAQDEPIRFQRDFHKILDLLSEKMTKRDGSASMFKIKISFKPNSDRRTYMQLIDYQQAKYCPTKYSQWGIDLYKILCEELNK